MSDYITIPLSKTGKYAGMYETIVSIEDADLAALNWTYRKAKANNGYAYRGAIDNGVKYAVQMHRCVLERILKRPLEKSELVDHINGNGLDNRRENLRLATHNQNSANLHFSRGSSYKGVYYHKINKKWVSQIAVNGKSIHLGCYDSPELAHIAYCEKAIELFGEFANFGNNSFYNKVKS